MMLTVGIPRGLLYYRYEILWKEFFDNLNVKYIVSSESNFSILKDGKNKSVDEACLSLKLFIGHVASLKGKCDLLFIPRIYSLEKTEQVCTNFNCLYDLIRNLYPELKIINYNVDVKHKASEKKAFLSLGKQLGFKKKDSLKAYLKAKEKERNNQIKLEDNLKRKLSQNKKKILLLGHPYNLNDSLIGKPVSNYLVKNNVEVIFSYELPEKYINEYYKKISPKVHWTMNKELLAAFMFYKESVDGIIVLNAFPCGPDSLTNEMILRKKGKSRVLLPTFEELSSDVAVITRLESFLDMIKGSVYLWKK